MRVAVVAAALAALWVAPAGADAAYVHTGGWGGFGSGDGHFLEPSATAVNATSGDVYVTADAANRVQRFSAAGNFLGRWGSAGSGDGQFSAAAGITVNPASGDVYVVEMTGSRVQRFSATGTFLGKWGSAGSGDGQLETPWDVAVNASNGDVYVADTGNHRIQRFSATGAFLGKWGTNGSGNGQFNMPSGVAIDAERAEVYVSDRNNHRIQRFTSTGAFLAAWGANGSGAGELSFPNGIDAYPAGPHVYVTDQARVQRFHRSGSFLEQIQIGSVADGLSSPRGPAVHTANGDLYVADRGNHLIRRFGIRRPVTSIVNGPRGSVSETAVTFRFAADVPGSTFACHLQADGGPVGVLVPCTSPRAYSGLADGAYVFHVRATDPVGHVEAPTKTRRFTVDTQAPRVEIRRGPRGRTRARVATFRFRADEPAVRFACRLDRRPWRRCSAPKRYSGLRPGRHVFRVRATDAADNTGPSARRAWRVSRR